MELVDIGANLTHESFQADLIDVLTTAREVGVIEMMVTGASEQGSIEASALARDHPGLYATAGIHPHHADEVTSDTWIIILDLLVRPEVKAVGETGLDYFRDFSPRDVQRTVFERHIELAVETGLPMFLHERDAHDDFFAILKAYRANLSEIVVHCFTGDETALRNYLDLDCFIGITGWICDERRGTHLHELVNIIPDDRLLIETDAPYLLPRTLRPKPKSRRNEPRHLPHICEYIATHRKQTAEEVAGYTTANARAFFRL